MTHRPTGQFNNVKSGKIDPMLATQVGIRLGAVASMVQEGSRVLDVGTDHGYLPIALVRSGRAERVIAGDVNHEPIRNARWSVGAEDNDVASKIEACKTSSC